MNLHAEIALASPVFDPDRDIKPKHFWWSDRELSVGLTCNIGME